MGENSWGEETRVGVETACFDAVFKLTYTNQVLDARCPDYPTNRELTASNIFTFAEA
jgi:hypothetical protein